MKNSKPQKESLTKNHSRREFLKKGGNALLVAQGIIIGGGSLIAGMQSCEPDEDDTNLY
jgi:hypothetical protein